MSSKMFSDHMANATDTEEEILGPAANSTEDWTGARSFYLQSNLTLLGINHLP